MRRLLRRAGAGRLRLLLNVVNLGEVYHRLLQLTDRTRADAGLAAIRAASIEVVAAREPLALEAARIKASHRLSYADAFAVATARIERAPVVTGDPEIIALPSSIVRVRRLFR